MSSIQKPPSQGNQNRRIAKPAKVLQTPSDPMFLDSASRALSSADAGDDANAAKSTTVRPPPPSPSDRKRSASAKTQAAAKTPVKKPLPRFVRTLQFVAGAMIVIAASIAVSWGARRYIMSSPRFAIRTVLVDGASRRSADDLAAAGGIGVGNNIFALDPETAALAIGTDPWIEQAKVTRKLPSTIQVNVVEREARALAAIGGDLYLATRDGDLFKRAGAGDPEDLPLVTGLLPEQVASDRAGAVLAIKRVLDVLEELERVGIAQRWPVQEMHLEKDHALVVTIGREAILLHLGHPPYRAKIEQGNRVLQELSKRKANASVIFVDNDAHPERVVARMR